MMTIAEHGFFPWVGWAFFNWRGRIKRLPYALGFLCLVLLVRIYTSAVAQWIAVNVAPPPQGIPLDPSYVGEMMHSPHIVPFLIPIAYLFIVLDIKRLRSMGAPILLAVVFSGLSPFVPVYFPGIQETSVMTMFAYHAILAVVPAKEDRLSPLERKALVWKALATGSGMPRRLRGRDIKSWHIVRQGPEGR